MAKSKKPVVVIEHVPLAKIERSGGTQARTGNNEDTIVDYYDALKARKPLPPPVVFKDADGKLWLADGFHRVEAHARFGSHSIDVERHMGDQRAAVLYAAGANAHHGLRRTREDKHRAVRLLLEDAEWSTWGDRRIAEHCHVSRDLVHAVMKATGRTASSVTTGADGKTRNTAGIAEANRERAVEKRAAATANTLTPESAPLPPAKPRRTNEGAQEDPGDGVPTYEHWEGYEPSAHGDVQEEEVGGGELVEDGALAESAQPGRPAEILGPGDPVGRTFAVHSRADVALWSEMAQLATDARKLRLALARLNERASATHFATGLNQASHDMKAVEHLLETLEPYVCPYCKGTYASCPECGGAGWMTRGLYERAPATLQETEQLAGDVDHWRGKLEHHNDACRSA